MSIDTPDIASVLTQEMVLGCARRLLDLRMHDPQEPRPWVGSADIAADLGANRSSVVRLLMQLGRAGALTVRCTHVGLDLEVTQVRVMPRACQPS
jgi:DNA-binding IclR family transcriptional regulator